MVKKDFEQSIIQQNEGQVSQKYNEQYKILIK